MSKAHTPFDVAIVAFGSVDAVAAACGRHRTTLYGWRRDAVDRAAGDIPSAATMRKLLTHARAHGIPLTADHLIWGASDAEMAALVAAMKRRAAPGPAPIQTERAA